MGEIHEEPDRLGSASHFEHGRCLCAAVTQSMPGTLLDGTGVSARHDLYLTVLDGRIKAISPSRPQNIVIKEFPSDTSGTSVVWEC